MREITSCLIYISDSLNFCIMLVDHPQLNIVCFQHDIAYGGDIDVPKRMTSDKVLCDKAFGIASNQKYDGYRRRLASIVFKFSSKMLRHYY